MLTRKERQVLELRKKGLKQQDIATKLKISQPAVSAFLSNAFRKIREAKKILKFVEELKLEVDDEQE